MRSGDAGFGEWLTITEAAKALGVTNHTLRRLIKTGSLPAVQVVPGAPYQISADDLTSEWIKMAVTSTRPLATKRHASSKKAGAWMRA